MSKVYMDPLYFQPCQVDVCMIYDHKINVISILAGSSSVHKNSCRAFNTEMCKVKKRKRESLKMAA